MKRPMLVSGTAIGLSSVLLVLAGLKAIPFLFLGAVLVFVLYFLKPLKLKEKIIIPTICISIILSCIFFSVYHFTKIVPATKLDNAITDVSGKIITTPQETAYGTKFILKTDRIGNNERTEKIQVFISSEYDIEFKLYDYISLPNAKLTVVKNDYNNPEAESMSDGVIIEATANDLNVLWASEKTPYYYCLRLKEIVAEQLNSYLSEYDAGFLLGMLFGDKTTLDSDIKNDFRVTGIAHLLAVSGLHTGIWCAYIIAFLKLLKAKEKLRNIFCLIFLCGLCIVSAFSPSVMRASIMMAVVLLAPFFNEEQDSLNSLGFGVAVLTLNNPYIITSVSFLLSVSATAGVLVANRFSPYITKITKRLNKNISKKFSRYLIENIVISAFAGLFTLPVTAFFFRTFCIISPITNILCVKPAFWGMFSGTISTAVSFIPFAITQDSAILLFKITSILLRFVTGVADFIGDFQYCSFPFFKEYFILGIIIIILILLIGLAILKVKKNNKIVKILAAICSVIIILCIVLPCTTITPPTLTILNVGNGLNASLRSGLHRAFFNCGTSSDETPYSALPSATSESLDFVYISAFDTKTNSLTDGLTNSKPETTILTTSVKDSYRENGKEFPQNTIISDSYSYTLNNEINVTTIDTHPVGCVIIEGNEKKVFLCFSSNLDLDFLFDTYGSPDVLVLSKVVPETLPENVDTLIISNDSEIIINQNLSALKNQCKKFYTTAEDGDIKIILGEEICF